jgi:hypothetical protein
MADKDSALSEEIAEARELYEGIRESLIETRDMPQNERSLYWLAELDKCLDGALAFWRQATDRANQVEFGIEDPTGRGAIGSGALFPARRGWLGRLLRPGRCPNSPEANGVLGLPLQPCGAHAPARSLLGASGFVPA